MFLIALRNLFGEKGRLIITAGGVAFSVLLILILVGLYRGWEQQMTRFLGHIQTDYWVGQTGSGDLSHSISLIPRALLPQFESKDYIDEVSPFFGRQTGVTINGNDVHLFTLGVDDKKFVGPYKLVEGSDNPLSGEIVIDITLARPQKLKIGDTIKVADTDLKIIGLSSGGNILAYTYALANIEDVKTVFGSKDLINYFMVRSTDPQAKEKLEKDFPDMKVMPKQEFLNNNKSILSETFLPLVGVLVLIALLIGTAVIGLTIFTATIEKSREYGVLKAIGYTNGQLFGIALIQSITAGIIGYGIGALFAPYLAKGASYIASGFLYEISTQELLAIAGITFLMSFIASLLPLRRLFAIDPAQVFKA